MTSIERVSLAKSIPIALSEDVDNVTRMVRDIAGSLGFSPLDANLLASATSELAMNIVLHAGHGTSHLEPTDNGRGLKITFADEGPGIADLQRAQIKGYSSRPDGHGLGLSAAFEAVEHFEIASTPGLGTTATISHYCPPDPGWFDIGVLSVADDTYPCNGDVYFTRTIQGDQQLVAVIDGIGQGQLAREAALCARRSLETSRTTDPCELVANAHAAVKESNLERGFTIALLIASHNELRLVTVGDVSCRVFNALAGVEQFHFAERHGTLGCQQDVQIVEQRIDIKEARLPIVVILASDGVSFGFSCTGDPISGDAIDLAHNVLNSFRCSSGDATVAVLRIDR